MMMSKQHVCALGTRSENQSLGPHSSKTQEGSQASGFLPGCRRFFDLKEAGNYYTGSVWRWSSFSLLFNGTESAEFKPDSSLS